MVVKLGMERGEELGVEGMDVKGEGRWGVKGECGELGVKGGVELLVEGGVELGVKGDGS